MRIDVIENFVIIYGLQEVITRTKKKQNTARGPCSVDIKDSIWRRQYEKVHSHNLILEICVNKNSSTTNQIIYWYSVFLTWRNVTWEFWNLGRCWRQINPLWITEQGESTPVWLCHRSLVSVLRSAYLILHFSSDFIKGIEKNYDFWFLRRSIV